MEHCRVAHAQSVVRIHLVGELRCRLHSGGEAYADAGLALLAALGGDEDDAVCTFHTVDCGSRGILEDGNGLDGADVDTVHIALYTVDKHEGRTVVP